MLFFRTFVLTVLLTLCCGQLHAAEPGSLALSEESRIPLSNAFLVYRNPDQPLSLAQARDLDQDGGFTALDPDSPTATNFGLTRDEIWLRLELHTRFNNAQRRLLEIAHPSLHQVNMYLVGPDGEVERQAAGTQVAFRDKPVQHRHHVFDLTLQGQASYTLYLQVNSQGTVTVPLTLWTPDELWRADQVGYAALTLYFGLMLALLVWNFFLFLSLRDPLYLIYIFFLGFLALGQAGLSGLSGQFLWPENIWLNTLTPAVVAIAGAFGALFVQRFLGPVPRSLNMHWFMPVMSVGYGLTFFSAVFVSYFLASILVNIVSLLLVVGAFSMGAVSLWRGMPGARFFVLAWAALLLGVLVIALHNLGVLPSNNVTSNALLIGSSVEMLLLSLALADRINDVQKARDRAQAETIDLKQKMLESEQIHRRELAGRVAERTAELQDANRRLEASQAELKHQANHDALTGLVNRNLWQDRLHGAASRARRQQSGFALVVVDLDNFKQVNDTHGHAAGDAVLVEMARRLMQLVRETDTVARLGGDEFVMILESVQCAADVQQLMALLVTAMNTPMMLASGKTISIEFSTGCALYPDHSDDIEILFNIADSAMYENKKQVRAGK